MSQAQLWAALQQSSTVGCERLAVPDALLADAGGAAPATLQAMQAALRQPAASPAAQLLRASAVAAVLERAGWMPGSQVQPNGPWVQPALPAPEARPAPQDARLIALMQQVLREGPQALLPALFHTLDAAGQRLPHALLVDALLLGRQSAALRPWLTPVLGERGRWLALLNPQWGYAGGVQEDANPDLVWQEGSLEQRVALLQSERANQPAQARARLEGSLKELSAKERAPMVQALRTGLSMDDEPLLEKLLTDRSKDVRENAARLLSLLPDSGHSQRLCQWLQAMLSRDDKGEWQIEPPEEGSKNWERDGIALQPPAYIKGVRAWWLQQMVELAPLGFWQRTLDKTPEQLWEWSRRSDWRTALRQGWLAALGSQHDVRWLEQLQTMGRDARADSLLPALLAQLTLAQREALWLAQLERDKGRLLSVIEAIDKGLPVAAQLSPALSAQLLDAICKAVGGKQATGAWHSYQADQAMLACVRMLDVSVLQRFAQLWRQPQAESLVEEAAEAPPSRMTLTPDQQERLERARRRPWDDEAIRMQLDRVVDLRLALHSVLQG